MQPRRVLRRRLLERFRRAQETRIVLLFADAGFGKSVALEQFLATDRRPCAFYRVPPDTTSLLGFLRGLTSALEPFTPGAHLSLTMAHTRAMQSRTPFVELASWFGEHLRDAGLCIAIDDLHNATADSIGDFLSRATAETPQSVRWIIAARPTPTFSAASWLAGGELDWPIDESELRMTREETRELAERCGRYLSAETTDEVLKVSGGHASSVALAIGLPDAALVATGAAARPYEALANAAFDAAELVAR